MQASNIQTEIILEHCRKFVFPDINRLFHTYSNSQLASIIQSIAESDLLNGLSLTQTDFLMACLQSVDWEHIALTYMAEKLERIAHQAWLEHDLQAV